MEMITFLQFFIALLFIAALVGIAVQRFRMPYTVGLVLMGLGLAVIGNQTAGSSLFEFDLSGVLVPQLILTILVPPLIFEAAFHIKFEELRRNLKPILVFAIPGMLITMLLVGGMISWGTALPIEIALIFGALIAATDPVAVVALFRSLGVPNQLLILLEGESLFNDGVAIVVFNLMIAIGLGTTQFDGMDFLVKFVVVAGGGLVVGALVSGLVSMIIRLVNNHLIEVSLTTVAAYGAYIIAEEMHVSGVLAVVVAGLVIGNLGERGMSPTTRINLFNFWEFAAYLSNSLAFLTIGLVIDLGELIASWKPVLMAIVAVLVARAIVIYLFSIGFRNIHLKMQHVIYWGGLRGAISLALALSLPEALGENQLLLQDMTFGVVLFTLLVQGTTMRSFVKRLGFSSRTEAQDAYERHQARVVASRNAFTRVKHMSDEGLISNHAWETLETPLQRQIELRTEVVREIMRNDRTVEVAELNLAAEEILRAQRTTYSDMFSRGAISEEIFSTLIAEVDAALINQDISYGDLLLRRTKEQPPISKLIFASVKQSDVDETLHMMGIMGVPTTRLVNSSGPTGDSTITLIIGVEDDQVDSIVERITQICKTAARSRKKKLVDLIPFIKPEAPTPPSGANIYVFDVEHYEEI